MILESPVQKLAGWDDCNVPISGNPFNKSSLQRFIRGEGPSNEYYQMHPKLMNGKAKKKHHPSQRKNLKTPSTSKQDTLRTQHSTQMKQSLPSTARSTYKKKRVESKGTLADPVWLYRIRSECWQQDKFLQRTLNNLEGKKLQLGRKPMKSSQKRKTSWTKWMIIQSLVLISK